MEARENKNLTQPKKGTPNPNARPTNINMKIDEGLICIRSIFKDLQSTREPTRLSLATSLYTIVFFIASAKGKLTNISYHRDRMFEHYNTSIDKNKVRPLNITKKELML